MGTRDKELQKKKQREKLSEEMENLEQGTE